MSQNPKVVVHLPPPTVADYERLRKENAALARQLAEMKILVNHMWVHAGYPICGYWQMDDRRKALFDATIAEDLDALLKLAHPAPDGKEGV